MKSNMPASRELLGRVDVVVLSRLPWLLRLSTLLALSLCLAGQLVGARLNFVSLGNWGFHSKHQQTVAKTLKNVARDQKVSFIVSPGSNFGGGVAAVNDTLWQSYYEDVYGDPSGVLKMQFFTVLGAEDWASNSTAQIERTSEAYSESSTSDTFPKWTLPNWWYHYVMHFPASTGMSIIKTAHKDMGVGFVFIDTWVLSNTFPFTNITTKAWEDLQNTLESAAKVMDYIIVVGDKSIYSSGASKGDSYLSYYLEPVLKKYKVDMYISGYDFNLEAIKDENMSHITCGSGAVGSGSASSKTKNSVFYSGEPGFCVHELNAEGIVTKFYDGLTGEVLFAHQQPIQNRPGRVKGAGFNIGAKLPEVKFWPVPPMGRMPSRDVFVRVIGTIGLAIAVFFLILNVASIVSKIAK